MSRYRNSNYLEFLQHAVNVKDYDATGNGTTDDSGAINRAIAALQKIGGGTLYFPPGTYYITNHVVIGFNNVHVKGAGIGATIIKVGAWVDGLRVSDTSYPSASQVITNIVIEDLTIDGNRSGWTGDTSDTYGNGINLNAVDYAVVRNVHVMHTAEQGIVSTYDSISGSVQTSLVIENCIVEDCQDNRNSIGIEGQASNCRVTNNTVTSTHNIVGIYIGNIGGTSIHGEHVVIGNNVVGGSGGIGIRVEDMQERTLISSNFVKNFDIGIRCSSTSTSTYDYLISNNYCVDWVSTGVMVFPMYSGDDSKSLIIGNQIKSANASASSYGIYADKNAVVCNNRVENGNTGIRASNGGQFIQGNWIHGIAGYSVDVGNSTGATVIGNYHTTDINMNTDTVNYGNFGYATERWAHLTATSATTVGAAGAASALPSAPVGYLEVEVTGNTYKVPYYNV